MNFVSPNPQPLIKNSHRNINIYNTQKYNDTAAAFFKIHNAHAIIVKNDINMKI